MKKIQILLFALCAAGTLLRGAEDILLTKAIKFNRDLGVEPVSDSRFAEGSAYRFDLSKGGWSIEFNPVRQSEGKISGENWDFYAVLRLEKPLNGGNAFHAGMYSYSRKKDLFKRTIAADELSADSPSFIYLGSTENPEGFLWAGGPSRKDAENAVFLEKIVARKSGGEIPAKFAGKVCLDLQKISFTPGRCRETGDPAASDGRAFRFKGEAPTWSFNAAPGNMGKAIAGNPWRGYAYLRAEGDGVTGNVFEIGLYDQNGKKHVLNVKIPMEYIKGGEYQEIELGKIEFKPGMYFWGGPQGNKNAKYVYLDRILLVSEKE